MTDKTDRQLLELGAKAAGVEGGWGERVMIGGDEVDLTDIWFLENPDTCAIWNPLEDDGDCARLEVHLELQIDIGDIGVLSERADGISCLEKYADHNGDRNSARRRASVRAAAEIGKSVP